MDMFKLLTRSTSIQKSAPAAKNVSSHHIPSAGPSHQNNGFHEHEDDPYVQETPVQRGIKRKRREARKEHGNAIPNNLNFFGDSARPPALVERPAKVQGLPLSGKQPSVQGRRTIETALPDLDGAECRRILKKNKVKIKILGDLKVAPDNRKYWPTGSELAEKGYKKDANTQLSPQPLTAFHQLRSKYSISRRLAENLNTQAYAEPTEVQLGSLPLLLGSDVDRGLGSDKAKESKKHTRSQLDLITIAPTGSGKTLAFMIHLLHGLLQGRQAKKKADQAEKSEHQIQALIIAPTHELADQIVNEGKKLALGTGIKLSGLKKGMKIHSELADVNDFANGESSEEPGDMAQQENGNVHDSLVKSAIIVSTPLLLLHALQTQDSTTLAIPNVRFLILDEADVLLDPLFREQTLGIWEACSNSSLQTSLWSATIGSSIESLAQTFILDRRRKLGLPLEGHRILRLVIGLKDSALPNISHRLVYAASEQGKLLALRQLLHPSATPTDNAPSLQPPFLIFTQTIPRAIALHSELLYDIPLEAGGSSRIAVLHSDLSDTARSNIMTGFRKGEIWILITTDLLSRGVDFRGMNGVVNYDIPNTGASYVHRAGRTGRQGREGGIAVTLYTKEDIPFVKNVANVIAASQKAKRKYGEFNGEGMQKWLIDALPDVSKKLKNDLRRRGVESRRTNTTSKGGREARKMRISTKSGYDRRLENKKKGAITESQRRLAEVDEDDDGLEDEEWGGIDD